ncbi:MAG: Sec-independent protein translocase subunit TatA [Actinomycetota bacterium]|nr:Sec-independent protein translocase subunit TatA [Actinomycetota bacterium]
MGQLRGWEWLILVAIVLLLFGAKRLPDTARGLGRSLRIFKAETKGLVDDGDDVAAVAASAKAAVTDAVIQPQAASATPVDRERTGS